MAVERVRGVVNSQKSLSLEQLWNMQGGRPMGLWGGGRRSGGPSGGKKRKEGLPRERVSIKSNPFYKRNGRPKREVVRDIPIGHEAQKMWSIGGPGQAKPRHGEHMAWERGQHPQVDCRRKETGKSKFRAGRRKGWIRRKGLAQRERCTIEVRHEKLLGVEARQRYCRPYPEVPADLQEGKSPNGLRPTLICLRSLL